MNSNRTNHDNKKNSVYVKNCLLYGNKQGTIEHWENEIGILKKGTLMMK